MSGICKLISVTAILFLVLACEKVENKSELKISVNPGSVEYLGIAYLSWGSTNVTDCKLNGKSVNSSGTLEITNLERDTLFILTGKGLKGETLTSKAEIKVGPRTKYYDYLDTLCTGRWVIMQYRVLGIYSKPNEWSIMNMQEIGDWSDGVSNLENPVSTIFSKDNKYNTLTYKIYDTYYMMCGPSQLVLSKDIKSLHLKGEDQGQLGKFDAYDVVSISNDSLVLFKHKYWTWAGGYGGGSGKFPTYVKYIHHNDLENKIETNDTTSVNYKLLTSGYWKLKRIKYFVDNVYKYDESLKEIVNEIEFKFSKDGVFGGYLDNQLFEGPNRWYLIDNNTKIWRAGFTPNYIWDIIKLDADSLILNRNVKTQNPEPDGKWNYSSQLFYYAR